jgi:diguanylate cyclase (GGDEF)-like protein
MRTCQTKPRFPASFCLLLVAIAATTALFAVTATTTTKRLTRQMAVMSARDLGEMLVAWSRGPIDRRDWASLNSLARLHSANPGLRFVSFVVKAEGLPAGDKPLPSRAVQTVPTAEAYKHLAAGLPDWAVVDVPIYAADESEKEAPRRQLGEVVLGIEPERAHLLISKAHLWIAGQAVILGILLIGLTLFFRRRIYQPVERLVAQADALVRRSSPQRPGSREASELVRVGHALGVLAEELSDRESELAELQQQIEQRVQERTELLRELASRDPLTGLHNRRYFSHTLGPAFDQAVRYDTPLALAMIDLDHFKRVNDEYGHVLGDEVLIILTTTLTTELRAADIGARFGGDEFVVLMPQTQLSDALQVVERIRDSFTQACRQRFNKLMVTLSIGVATVGPGIDSAEELLAAADVAMYRAKNLGKDRICCHQDGDESASRIDSHL